MGMADSEFGRLTFRGIPRMCRKSMRLNKFIRATLHLDAGKGPIKKSDFRRELKSGQTPPEIYTREELKSLFEIMTPDEVVLFELFLHSGLRKREVMFLEDDDLIVETLAPGLVKRQIRVTSKHRLGFMRTVFTNGCELAKLSSHFVSRSVKGELFAFAGLWDRWKDPSGNWIKTCSILTTTPNAVTSPVHDRMPVILDPDGYDLWLDPGLTNVAAASELLKPYDARLMRCYPAGNRVNSTANDDEECSRPVEIAEVQNSLFS